MTNKYKNIIHVNWLKTLFVNFKMLPLKQAIKLPIVVGYNTILRDLSGKIEILCPPRFNLISIGVRYGATDSVTNATVVTHRGRLVINGYLRLHTGSILWTSRGGLINVKGGGKVRYKL